MPIDRRVSIITLGVADLARATDFYARLGWTKSAASQEAITFIQLKGTVLALFSRLSLAEDAHVEPGEGGFSGVTLAHKSRFGCRGGCPPMPHFWPPAPRPSNSPKRSSGAAIRAMSPIPTGICGRSPTIPFSRRTPMAM